MKRKKKSGGGANWQDTYGDMVTLLLCFFVLLYSISSVDQVKWANLVRSLNPDVQELSQVVLDPEIEPGNEEVPGSIQSDEAFDQIYDGLVSEMEKLNMQNDVEITEGDDFQFISYRDKVFFDGYSSVLREEGKRVLDGFARAIKPGAHTIKEIRVKGHTSQAEPDKPNTVETDRELAGQRASRVVSYIQRKNIIDPGGLVGESYGQFHPIATFKTQEGRAENRRVEILILKKGSSQKSLSDYYDEVYGEDSSEANAASEAN